ncbi:ISL3 family transposase [Staphylococcus sp. IVB6181]|uniref:ISL3 family transposase n=1 Tax=Staphylococcus sp. IVB6181 TaxID=2929481 RepID=UPI0021CF0A07|nr:ISL3 family transposase [Staphylococcus sp. IVB6181]UXV34972.1 ISL3 family transposase [Staphylococcus sp. IVB6181]
MTHCIAKILDYKGKNITFSDDVQEVYFNLVRTLLFKGTLTYTPDCCENCGAVNENHRIVKNGKRKTRIKLMKIQGSPSYLELKKQRFFCRSCHSSFVAKTNFVKKHHNFCNKLALHILYQSHENRSCKGIAYDNNVSSASVIRYINKTANSVKLGPFNELPKHIMVDEFKSVKNVVGKMSFIFCDGDTHQIVDILPDRRKRALFAYFIRFDREVRKRVETVTTDMYSPYISLFKQLFPNAKIILDRFHLVQALNRELNRVRIRIMNEKRHKDGKYYRKLKHYWKLILKPSESLNSTLYKDNKLFPGLESEKSMINFILGESPELKDVYDKVNALRTSIKTNENHKLTHQILKYLKDRNTDGGLKRVLKSFRNFLPEIMNALNHPGRSNGPIETINNNIKVLKRIAYGYRNFYNFRNRILIKFKLLAKKKHRFHTPLPKAA